MPGSVKFFKTPRSFRTWLQRNHESKSELWVGFFKKGTGKSSITWPESVDQALCFGWIDGLRKRIDDESYKIRFTPRRPTSLWSAVNLSKFEELEEAGLMQDAGRAAYNKKTVERSKVYSYERKNAVLAKEYEREIRKNDAAWRFWQELTPYKKKATIHWVMSAKKEETRLRRLAVLIESAEEGDVVPSLRRT